MVQPPNDSIAYYFMNFKYFYNQNDSSFEIDSPEDFQTFVNDQLSGCNDNSCSIQMSVNELITKLTIYEYQPTKIVNHINMTFYFGQFLSGQHSQTSQFDFNGTISYSNCQTVILTSIYSGAEIKVEIEPPIIHEKLNYKIFYKGTQIGHGQIIKCGFLTSPWRYYNCS